MTDYTELVRKMRTCIGDKKCFEKECRYWSELGCMDGNICCDAAAAIEELLESVGMLGEQRSYWIDKAAEYYNQLPKLGEWIDRYDEDDKPFFKRKYVCSACGDWNTYGKSDYCPNCGAKMDGERKEGQE